MTIEFTDGVLRPLSGSISKLYCFLEGFLQRVVLVGGYLPLRLVSLWWVGYLHSGVVDLCVPTLRAVGVVSITK